MHHPHLHCLVPGGGIAPDGQNWVTCRPGFFLPVRVLSRLFRGLFLRGLEKAFAAGDLHFFNAQRHLQEPAAFRRYLAPLHAADWVVFAKRPFAGPAQVLEYVGRYTHRVALSNNRLLSIDSDKVRFRWKDYRDGDRPKTMTLGGAEFIRRFLIHVLPDGFHRIRSYGFLGNHHRTRKLELCRALIGMTRDYSRLVRTCVCGRRRRGVRKRSCGWLRYAGRTTPGRGAADRAGSAGSPRAPRSRAVAPFR
jgi:hypothetical protein